MATDYIIHFMPEIPQIMVGQEASNGQTCILNIISGQEALELMRKLTGGINYENRGRIKKA